MKKLTHLSLTTLIIISCSKKHYKQDHTIAIPEVLNDKASVYCERAYQHYKSDGYVHHKCDSVGFTSLYARACQHLDIDLTKFEDSQGKLYRDPNHSCFPHDSKAESSKDMTLMRMTAAWYLKDLSWVKRFLGFVEKNNYKFCEAVDKKTELSTCVLSYSLLSLLYDMRDKLNNLPTKYNPDDIENENILGLHNSSDSVLDELAKSINYVGYRAHLAVLKIDLAGSIYGYVSSSQRSLLQKLAEREPLNGLYQMAWAKWGDGTFGQAFDALLDESHFPLDRLPNNHEHHCTKYLYQRDMLKDGLPNPDWMPCPNDPLDNHPGTEVPFTLSLIK